MFIYKGVFGSCIFSFSFFDFYVFGVWLLLFKMCFGEHICCLLFSFFSFYIVSVWHSFLKWVKPKWLLPIFGLESKSEKEVRRCFSSFLIFSFYMQLRKYPNLSYLNFILYPHLTLVSIQTLRVFFFFFPSGLVLVNV